MFRIWTGYEDCHENTARTETADPKKPIHTRNNGIPPDVERIKEALGYINPSCSRGEWLNIYIGLHFEFMGNDVGFNIAHEWSRNGKNYVSEADCKKTWDSGHLQTGGYQQI